MRDVGARITSGREDVQCLVVQWLNEKRRALLDGAEPDARVLVKKLANARAMDDNRVTMAGRHGVR